MSVLAISMPVFIAREEASKNTETGKISEIRETGDNSKNSKNGDKDEN